MAAILFVKCLFYEAFGKLSKLKWIMLRLWYHFSCSTAAQWNGSKPGLTPRADPTLFRYLLPQGMCKMQIIPCIGPQCKWSVPSKLTFLYSHPRDVCVCKAAPSASDTWNWKMNVTSLPPQQLWVSEATKGFQNFKYYNGFCWVAQNL